MARHPNFPLLDARVHHPGAARHTSAIDASVNVVDRRGYEARYVRRTAERAVIYVSPQNGCAQGCTMCWLTAQRMTRAEDARLPNLLAQLGRGLAELDAATVAGVPPPAELHVDFMGRGDALASRELPAALPGFRQRRMPAADDVDRSFDRLADLASAQRRAARIHFALVPGENDDLTDAEDLLRALQARGLRARVNLVAYNPPPGEPLDPDPVASAARAAAYLAVLRASPMIERVKQILPVGRDVHAACGMFAGSDPTTHTHNPDESEST